jgi:tetratricopeptide (TPR) repeat protein
MNGTPKSEIRNPKQVRSPKPEGQRHAVRAVPAPCGWSPAFQQGRSIIGALGTGWRGFRASGLSRFSVLESRLSVAAFALCLLASTAPAHTNTNSTVASAPVKAAPLPDTPRDYYNAGTEHLRAGKLREAEIALMTAAARDQQEVQTHALYNLGQTRFQQGVEALKKSPEAEATRQRGDAAGELADRAIRNADAALANGETTGLLRAYLEGRGARKELREAMKVLDKALEAHRTTLLRWQRSAGDFRSAHELQPRLDDARFNGSVVDRHIAKLVDQQEQLKQCMGGMGNKLANLKMKLSQMKGQMPGGLLPKGGEEDEDEEEDGGKREPEQEEGKGKKEEKKDNPNGERMALTQEEAANLLNSFKLDANRKLPMGDRETAKPQDKKGKDY